LEIKIINPFYNEENSRDLAILAVPGNSDSFHHVHFCLEDEQTNERGVIVNKKKDNFGWGRVYREYPTKYTLTYDSDSKKIKGGYTRVYRYVGR
jgi:hypothetical protein